VGGAVMVSSILFQHYELRFMLGILTAVGFQTRYIGTDMIIALMPGKRRRRKVHSLFKVQLLLDSLSTEAFPIEEWA
jgi:hypothetical protein